MIYWRWNRQERTYCYCKQRRQQYFLVFQRGQPACSNTKQNTNSLRGTVCNKRSTNKVLIVHARHVVHQLLNNTKKKNTAPKQRQERFGLFLALHIVRSNLPPFVPHIQRHFQSNSSFTVQFHPKQGFSVLILTLQVLPVHHFATKIASTHTFYQCNPEGSPNSWNMKCYAVWGGKEKGRRGKKNEHVSKATMLY